MLNTITRLTIGLVGIATVVLTGCSDPTLPYREDLAMRITRAVAWRHPDLEAVPVEMQRMHLGAGSAGYTANTLEEFLASSPPLDRELLSLVDAFAKSSRKMEAQYKSAIKAGRSDLSEDELKIAVKCNNNEFFLMDEIFKRLDVKLTTEP